MRCAKCDRDIDNLHYKICAHCMGDLMVGEDEEEADVKNADGLLEKLEKMVLNADHKGENIIICYDFEDGFWIGKRDRFEPDPRPLECGKKNGSLGAAIEAACWQMAIRKAL